MNTKQVFIGSSTEGKRFAEIVIRLVNEAGLLALPWFDFFQSSQPPLQELERLTLRADAAILIASADDAAIIREKKWHQMRDNVLFEYGLFAGTIGRAKCGLLLPDSDDFRIPSDFLGVACFKPFNGTSIDGAAKATVASLLEILGKPQPPETTLARGRRLLLLIGWIRDECFRIVHPWDRTGPRYIAASRIIAASGFLHDDIEQLGLRMEYEKLQKVILEGIEDFPDVSRNSLLSSHGYQAIEAMMRGWVYPDPEVLEGFFHKYRQAGIPAGGGRDCPCGADWRDAPRAPYWSGGYYSFTRGSGSICGLCAYAHGAAEAVTAFGKMIYEPVSQMRGWGERFAPRIRDSAASFERKLHEQIFGPLTT